MSLASSLIHHHTHRPHVAGHGDVVVVNNLRSQELRRPAQGSLLEITNVQMFSWSIPTILSHLLIWGKPLGSSKINDFNQIFLGTNNILWLK